jgi:hypothetical protein
LKFLVIAGLIALLFLLVYSRVYPYLQALKKILSTARSVSDAAFSANTATREDIKTDNRLVRCVGCGTWIPAARAVGKTSGSPVYCSRECIEKQSSAKNRKLAG